MVTLSIMTFFFFLRRTLHKAVSVETGETTYINNFNVAFRFTKDHLEVKVRLLFKSQYISNYRKVRVIFSSSHKCRFRATIPDLE